MTSPDRENNFETSLGSLAYHYLRLELQEADERRFVGSRPKRQEIQLQYNQRLAEVITAMADLTVSALLLDEATAPAVLKTMSNMVPVLNTNTGLLQFGYRKLYGRNPSMEFTTGVVARLVDELNKSKSTKI